MSESAGSLPWKAMWDFLASLGELRDFPSLIDRALVELPRLIPHDISYACLSDGLPARPGRPFELHSIGLPDRSRSDYLHRYFKADPVMLSLDPAVQTYDMRWRDREYHGSVFVEEFIKPLSASVNAGIACAATPAGSFVPEGFGLGFMRGGKGQITARERGILRALRPHIVNYREIMARLDSLSPEHYFASELAQGCRALSRREAAVVAHLCRRLRAREIATMLLISPRTVERHIEHIYEKLQVSNRNQLLKKLLGTDLPRSRGFAGTGANGILTPAETAIGRPSDAGDGLRDGH
jgi:DNA-binding CsgD family transcriptional regulator